MHACVTWNAWRGSESIWKTTSNGVFPRRWELQRFTWCRFRPSHHWSNRQICEMIGMPHGNIVSNPPEGITRTAFVTGAKQSATNYISYIQKESAASKILAVWTYIFWLEWVVVKWVWCISETDSYCTFSCPNKVLVVRPKGDWLSWFRSRFWSISAANKLSRDLFSSFRSATFEAKSNSLSHWRWVWLIVLYDCFVTLDDWNLWGWGCQKVNKVP